MARGDRARRARRRGALPRPAVRRQRPLAPRSPRGDARGAPRRPAARSSTSTRCSTAATSSPTSALEYVDRIERYPRQPAAIGHRRPDRLGRWPHAHHDGPLRSGLGDGRARLAHARARRCAAVRVGDAGGRDAARRAPRRDRSGSAGVHRRAARADAGRRRVRDVQLPRRSRDRDLARVRRRRVRQVRSRAPPRRALRRDDGVRRRPPHPAALPGVAAGDRAPDGRDPRGVARHAARDLRDPEVRPRHVLLERQPQRHVRRRAPRRTSRSRPTACRSSSGRG